MLMCLHVCTCAWGRRADPTNFLKRSLKHSLKCSSGLQVEYYHALDFSLPQPSFNNAEWGFTNMAQAIKELIKEFKGSLRISGHCKAALFLIFQDAMA